MSGAVSGAVSGAAVRRIVLVVPSLAMGGAERVMLLLARGLAQAGVDVTLVAIDGSGPLRAELATPPFRFVDLGLRRARTALPTLVRTVRALRPDVVISSQTHLSALLVLARPLLGGVRVGAREPMRWVDGPRERATVRVARRVAHRRTDLVLATSPAMRTQLSGLLQRDVGVLPNPVDVDVVRARAAAPVRAGGPGRRFVFVGRLAPGKGLEDLLAHFARSTDPTDHLTIVGDGPLAETVHATVARLGLDARVRLTGMLTDPVPLIAGADAVVLPSVSEGMPNVALEALAVGTPVLATTDLVTLVDLAQRTPDGSLRLVERAALGEALAVTPVLGPGPRPSLLPTEHHLADVVTALRRLLAAPTDAGEGTVAGAGADTAAGGARRLRILMPMLAPYPSTLASSVQSANMAQALAELGHDVTLVAPNPDPELGTVAGATDPASLYGFTPAFRSVVLSGRVHRGQSYTHALRILAMTRRERPDLVLSRDLRGCLLPARRGIPTVFEAHSLTSLEGPQERWVIRRLLRTPGFLGMVAISTPLAEDLAAAAGVPRERILVEHDAVRPTVTAPHPRIRTAGGTLRVGYVGSLFAGRGVELLADVAARAPWIELHLVGGPAEAARGWTDRLAQVTPGRAVVHGLVSPARARELQGEVDVLVAPFARRVSTDSGVDTSRWMSPMKVFEYMASGRPIVISDLPVLREVLRPDVDALMVPPEDPEALLAALERLRDDPALGERLAASALERVRSTFTWELRARRILARFCA